MLKKINKAANPPITAQPVYKFIFAALFCLLVGIFARKLFKFNIWLPAAYIAVNVCILAGWGFYRNFASPKRLAANRMSERLFGVCLLFNLFFCFSVYDVKSPAVWEIVMVMLLSFVFAAGIAAFFAYAETKLLITELEITSPKLTRDKIRIIHITDLHVGLWAGADYLHELVNAVNRQQPDIIVCTGDMKDELLGEDCGEELTELARLQAHDGKFAIFGNHDYVNTAEAADFAGQCGFTVLDGRAEEAAGLVIAGCGDRDHLIKQQWGLTKSEHLILNYEFVQQKAFLVVLRHRQLAEDGQQTHFDLQLSGSKHGISPFRLILRKLGLAAVGRKLKECRQGGLLYKTDGAGYIGAPVRVFCKPEITIIDLIKEDEEA